LGEKILEVKNLTKYFGQLAAVKNISFEIDAEEIIGVIGPNGSGKTTLLNLITGFLRPEDGSIKFKNINIVGYKPHQIVKIGIARTFQHIRPFRTLTVEENIKVALIGIFGGSEMKLKCEIDKVLKFMELYEKRQLPVGSLPYIDQKKVEIARAIATKPCLLFLDEPFSGLSPCEIAIIRESLLALNREGITLTIIEHKLQEIMRLVKRLMVLDQGKIIADGNSIEIFKNEKVAEVFSGMGSIVAGG